ncbi:MAG: hypothetical protein ACI81T_003946, partial [Bacteroidia bacterium]
MIVKAFLIQRLLTLSISSVLLMARNPIGRGNCR